jgi:hypothetical protein
MLDNMDPDLRQPKDSKYLPPYGIILSELRAGNAIPFLGAGASRVGYIDGASGFLPSGGALAQMLAQDARFPSNDQRERQDLSKVASYFVDGSNRDALRRKLRTVFGTGVYSCNGLHEMLAAVADKLVIVTTNYDTLLEQAFLNAGKPYDLVVYPADNAEYRNAILWWPHGATDPSIIRPNQLDEDEIGRNNVIYKIHGSVRPDAKWDSFVITEEDYIQFLSRISNAVPAAFKRYFSARAFLFLGYSLRDWNMRVLLKQMKISAKVSWAIYKDPSAVEEKIWHRRGVDIYDVTLEDFIREMSHEITGL